MEIGRIVTEAASVARGVAGSERTIGRGAYNPEHHNKTKHIARRHFFVRDMVEREEIVVPFVRTHENISDFLTKAMTSAPAFFAMRAVVMNEPARAATVARAAA